MRTMYVIKERRATNCDDVPSEAYKYSDVAGDELYELCKEIWTSGDVPQDMVTSIFVMIHKKGDRNDKWNYRPIGLLSHAYKILSQLILLKLRPVIEAFLPESQAGFRAHRGTRDATTILSLLMESALREGRKIIAVFLDFKDAFSTISHKYMDRVLKRAKVSTKIRTLIRSIYTHAHGKVRQQNADGSHEFSAAFDINRGVIQGDIFSPVVFIAGLAGIMDMALTPDHRAKLVRDGSLTVGDECYADDTALFAELSKEESEGKTDAEIRDELTKVATTKATRFATQAYDIAALEVKPSKTNGMIIEHHAKCSITEADILEAAKSWKHRCPDCNRGFHTKSSMYTHQNLQCQMPATEKHWTVDKVVDTCTCLNGQHFQVRWAGTDDEGDTWP